MYTEVQGTGGAIAVNSHGETAVDFNTQGMSWCKVCDQTITHGIYKGEVIEKEY